MAPPKHDQSSSTFFPPNPHHRQSLKVKDSKKPTSPRRQQPADRAGPFSPVAVACRPLCLYPTLRLSLSPRLPHAACVSLGDGRTGVRRAAAARQLGESAPSSLSCLALAVVRASATLLERTAQYERGSRPRAIGRAASGRVQRRVQQCIPAWQHAGDRRGR